MYLSALPGLRFGFAESSIKDVAIFHATFSHNRGHVFDKNLAKLHDIYKK